MKVFKFGGASVKDAEAVRNVGRILGRFPNEPILVVISAMGKITNLLEDLVSEYFSNNENKRKTFEKIKDFHHSITRDLMGDAEGFFFYEVDNLLIELECLIEGKPDSADYDFIYDQIVSFGELISTKILSHYLNYEGIKNRWMDARNFISTSEDYRQAIINWEDTVNIISNKLKPLVEKQLTITQGFIGKSGINTTTTLGREGSDYSAAIFAFGLDADSVTIWKDVAGVMNADPKKMPEAFKIDELSFVEAIELAYYGATIIHPKTIQPLKSKNIPLHVKSFLNPDQAGTVIYENMGENVSKKPFYIFKENQVLIHLYSKDFSFIVENNLSKIFALLAKNKVQLNLMQNSAISFSFCVNNDPQRLENLLNELKRDFNVETVYNLKLVTLHNYDEASLQKAIGGGVVELEHKSKTTVQLVLGAH